MTAVRTCWLVAASVAGAVVAWGCTPARWEGPKPPRMRLVVEDLGKDDDIVLVAALETIPGVKKVEIEEKKGGRVVLGLDYEGSACEIPARVKRSVKTPGLKPDKAEVTYTYAAFDRGRDRCD